MTPLDRCVRQIDLALLSAHSSVADEVMKALEELEVSFVRLNDRIVALESVFHAVAGPDEYAINTEMVKFITRTINQRQEQILLGPA